MKFLSWGLMALTAMLSCPLTATAEDLTIGMGLGYLSSPYKGHDNMSVPVPLVHYEGENFYVRGVAAGFKIWDSSPHEFSVGLSYHFNEFNPDDTNSTALRQLNKRRAEVRADARYLYRSDYGTLILTASREISDRSGGSTGDITFRRTYDFGSFSVVPAAGLTWESAKTLGYYYGISAVESQRSGLRDYNPDSGWSPHLGIAANFYLTDTLSVTAGGRVSFLSDEIKDSPMVDSSSMLGATLGISYAF